MRPSLKVVVGADHGGYALKENLKPYLSGLGYRVVDVGTNSEDRVDYPHYALKVAEAVSRGAADRGVLICKSGIGMTVVSNKFPGVRAALCQDERAARQSREHVDANVLVFGSFWTPPPKAKKIVKIWLATPFEGGRHLRRVSQITRIEKIVLKRSRR